MISEGAVKAAWLASLRNDLDSGDIIRILEAAAPYMLAAVADEREGDLFRFTLAQRAWLRSTPYSVDGRELSE